MLKNNKSSAIIGIAIVGLIINFGLLLVYYIPSTKQLIGDENYYNNYALLVVSGQRTPDNLIWPPLYGEFIGLLFSIFGSHRIYIQIIQIGLWLISGILFSQIVKRLTLSPIVAHISFTLFLLSPELIAFSHYLWPEIMHLFLWILGLWLLICYPQRRLAAIITGVAFGLALLTKSLLTPFIPVVVLFVLIRNYSSLSVKTRLINTTLILAFILLTTLPVMVNNLITQGEFTISDSSIFNIWVGLNDLGKTDYGANEIAGKEFNEYMLSGSNHRIRNLVYKEKIVKKLEQQGLVGTLFNQLGKQYFRLFDIQTFFTTQLPGGGRQAYTTDAQWLITFLKLYSYIIYGLILVAGTAGVCFLQVRYVNWSHLFVLFIIYNLGLFLFLHVKTRYVLQFLPMLILFASVTTYWLISIIKKTDTPPLKGFVFNKFRVICALLVGTLTGVIMIQSLI